MAEQTAGHAWGSMLRGPADEAQNDPVIRRNWPLLLGSFIVLLIVLVAIAGPALAPHDPLVETRVIKVGENKWLTPPFAPLTVPGFPLGSDQFGRDLFSRLLWAVRPTMIMVAVVAAVRLLLGTVIGMVAGWSTSRTGRVLDMAIAGALAVPALIVALGGIAAVGVELGLLAFIIGLSITGWAETARLVREQTQSIQGEDYVQAARALGASNFQILILHVLRQIMPMVWMLFSFEISSTLMATAGLGFLGYYIGGDVWVDVEDYVARRISGMPELGQMLATSWEVLTEPWAMVVVGSVIFVAVLGFNLLGEGLRRQLSFERMHQRTIFGVFSGRAGAWLEDAVLVPAAGQATKAALVRAFLAGLAVVVIGGGLLWWRTQAATQTTAVEAVLEIPGGHLWATERRDPYGTRWSPATGPSNPEIQWVYEEPSGFAGGPAVAADGTVYIALKEGTLSALDPDGKQLWQGELPATPVGAPALGVEGDVYVADKEGNLTAFTPDGELRWTFQREEPKTAIAGPIVGPDGTIYYPAGSNVHAVSPDGGSLWVSQVPYGYRTSPLRLTPDAQMLFWEDLVLDAVDGTVQELDTPADRNQYFLVGADGGTYLLSGSTLMEWHLAASGFAIDASSTWNLADITVGLPQDAGVTPGKLAWLYFAQSFLGGRRSNTRVVWGDMEGRILADTRHAHQPPNQIIAVDQDTTAYVCGQQPEVGPNCLALKPESEEPIWQVFLENGERVTGGALVPGRLYVAMEEGFLYAIGDAQP